MNLHPVELGQKKTLSVNTIGVNLHAVNLSYNNDIKISVGKTGFQNASSNYNNVRRVFGHLQQMQMSSLNLWQNSDNN